MKIKSRRDGLVHEAIAERVSGQIWIHFEGQTWTQPLEKKSRSRSRRLESCGKEVLAPMPGKIIKVNVKPGDMVQPAQVVVVMEAMKMEYYLKAEDSKKVKEVFVVVGQQVKLGERLVEYFESEK